MQLEERMVGNVAIVKITGEITLKQSRKALLHDMVRSLALRGHKHVLVDLAEVSYVDSAGLGELVQTNSTLKNHGGALKLFSPTSRMRELLVLTKLTTVIGTFDDEAQALVSVASPQL